MNPDLLEYGLRVSTIWVLLLGYHFIAGRKAGIRLQRVTLLGGWLFGLVIPLLPAPEMTTTLPVVDLPRIALPPVLTAATNTPTEATIPVSSWRWQDFLPWAYLIGVLMIGARTLVQSRWIGQCIATGKRSSFAGYPVVTSSRVTSPFAARGYVFMPEGLDPALTHTALLHETAHLRARHHYDKTLLTLGCILLWFHPLMWVYRRLLATVHEYEADAAVVQSVPARTYGLQLLTCSLGPTGSLGLFSSPLKQRIEMITSLNPKQKNRFLPLLSLALLLAFLTFACSDAGESLAPGEETFSPVPVLGLDVTPEVDEYPRLVAGPDVDAPEEALARAIFAEIRYPAEARKMAYEGTIRATIVYGADGKMMDDLTIYRELSGEELKNSSSDLVITGYKPAETKPLPSNVRHSVLLDEVVRTMNTLGAFQPITADGVPTSFVLELDFTFKLEQ